MRALLHSLLDYNIWAQDQFFDALEAVTEDEFLRDLGDGVGSLRDKLAHIYGAENVWFDRISGVAAPGFPTAAELPDKLSLVTRWKTLRERMRAWFSALTDAELHRTIAYKSLAGRDFTSPLWHILTHVINHGTYHRGQAASLLRRLKGKPPVTDMIAFYRHKENQHAKA